MAMQQFYKLSLHICELGRPSSRGGKAWQHPFGSGWSTGDATVLQSTGSGGKAASAADSQKTSPTIVALFY